MPQPSNQYESLTTSSEGVNVMPVLLPKSHFFLENTAFTQEEAERFGAISTDQFNTTAKVRFSGSRKVHAICKGSVFLQPNALDPLNKVNLVLKPYVQPIKEIPIKYIVYRGLDKDSLIASTGLVAGDENSGSGFVQYIWQEFKSFYASIGISEPDFSSNFLGYPNTPELLVGQDATDLIDEYFFKITDIDTDTEEEDAKTAYELPIIPRGIELGTASDEIGIDIVLNRGDYYQESSLFKLDLAYARSGFHSLNTSTFTDAQEKKRYREFAVDFMDVTALFGLHANGQGELYIADSETPLTSKEDIYAQIENFTYSKNTIYLYAQANRQRSYNFYNNYNISEGASPDMKIGSDTDNMVEETFGKDDWPVHEVAVVPASPVEDTRFAFQLTTDNYNQAAAYVKIGGVLSANEGNFIREENLLQTPSEDSDNPVDTTLTLPIEIQVSATSVGVLSSYVELVYEGREMSATEPAPPDQADQSFVVKDIDDMFGLLNAEPFTKTKPNIVEFPSLVDEKLQIISFPNSQQGSDVGVIKAKRIKDTIRKNDTETLSRITYETLLLDTKNANNIYLQSNSNHIDSGAAGVETYSDELNNFYRPSFPYYIKKQLFNRYNTTIDGVALDNVHRKANTKKLLGLTNDENTILKGLVTTHSLSNAKIYFKNQLSSEEETYSSSDGITYRLYTMGVVGEDASGELKAYQPSEANTIRVYTLDRGIYFSEEYAKYIADLDFDVTDLLRTDIITQE